jgi:hypothetical protein
MSNEYPVHTNEQSGNKPSHPWGREMLLHFVITSLFAGGLIWTVVAYDETTLARAAELSKAKEMQKDDLLPTPSPTSMSPDELNGFVSEVQNLIENDWKVKDIGIDGVITIEGKDVTMKCGVLDPTPDDTSDNDFLQYPDTKRLSSKLGVVLPSETILIWDRNIGMLPEGDGVAADVDTDSYVWACPSVMVAQ